MTKEQATAEMKYRLTKYILQVLLDADSLSDTLTDEQKETLVKYDDCVNEMYGIIEREIFAYAFRLGGQLMLETLKG